MDPQILTAAGLTSPQAAAYALLLETGSIQPADTAAKLKLTRSNAYKVLDKLVELGLAKKYEQNKKFVYTPDNPLALVELTYRERTKLVVREEAVKSIMDTLLTTYFGHTEQPAVQSVTGRQAVYELFARQADLKQQVYFIRSIADISSMTFDLMREIRARPAHNGQQRAGITPDAQADTPVAGDKRSNLDRTWVRSEDYTAPVEWSVSGPNLLIILYGSEPHAISITNPMIAEAFRQVFTLLSSCLKAMPYYSSLPRSEKSAS